VGVPEMATITAMALAIAQIMAMARALVTAVVKVVGLDRVQASDGPSALARLMSDRLATHMRDHPILYFYSGDHMAVE
jgi:hypothetical protein